MSRVRVLVATLLAALLATAAIAGCGGDDDSASASKQLSSADFEQKADEVCTSLQSDLEKSLQGFDPTKESSLDDAANKVADALHTIADRLRAVGYPAGKQDEANAFYDAIDDAASEIEDDPKALTDTDSKAFDDLDDRAKAVGLDKCGDN
jgi:hypothetical protein